MFRKACFLFILAFSANFLISVPVSSAQAPVVKVALNDLPGLDMLAILVAFEKAKVRGINIEVSYLQSEGLASQSVVSGQYDIGMGTPYQLIQKTNANIRMFFQLNKLRFHPVVNTDFITSWKDLDNAIMYSHGAGSGTEAIMNMLAKKNGIQYKEMKYVPGSGVRARAMIKQQIMATVVDTERRNLLLNTNRGNFAVLPMEEINASDEALYANNNFIKSHSKELKILLEELLWVWNKLIESPAYILEAKEEYNLLPKLGKDKHEEILSYYTEMVEVSAFPMDGGANNAFDSDIDFYGFAGTITDIETLKETDFWSFDLLREILNENVK